MLCIAALIVFSILGIFSLSYRKLAKKALNCVLKKVSFRACDADFQTEIKAKIIGFFVRNNLIGQKFVYKNYEKLAFAFSIIFLASLVGSAYFSAHSIYNYINYGTCNIINPESCPFAKTSSCLFEDKSVLKKLALPPAKDNQTAAVYQRLPGIAQKRILNRAWEKLSETETKEFEQILETGDGYRIQIFLMQKIPDYEKIAHEEFERLKNEVIQTLNLR